MSNPLPVNERLLCRYVAYLASEGLSPKSIKLYLSAIRHLQIEFQGVDPKIHAMPTFSSICNIKMMHAATHVWKKSLVKKFVGYPHPIINFNTKIYYADFLTRKFPELRLPLFLCTWISHEGYMEGGPWEPTSFCLSLIALIDIGWSSLLSLMLF